MCDCNLCTIIKEKLAINLKVYETFKWLIDSYVLDFYVDDHWNLLPNSWKNTLDNISHIELSNLLDTLTPLKGSKQLHSLSILSLRALLPKINISRLPINVSRYKIPINHCIHFGIPLEGADFALPNNSVLDNVHLKHMLWRQVSLKKKHEILVFTQFCDKITRRTDCKVIIDFGSGLGHLARILAYCFGFRVCCVEADEYLCKEAEKLDIQFEQAAKKYVSEAVTQKRFRPIHINKNLTTNEDMKELIQRIKSSLKMVDDDFKFGVVGLHPCGDLTSILLRLFKENEYVKFFIVSSCCYMKVSTELSHEESIDYPLSQDRIQLSYISRELACHSIENYIDKLYTGTHENLKIHAFRAAVEKLIDKYCPSQKHVGLRNTRYRHYESFKEYYFRATEGINLHIPETELESEEIQTCLKEWKKVVTFYSLRLMLAPLVETIILLERFLYICSSETECSLVCAFDPKLSPRCHILLGTKNCK